MILPQVGQGVGGGGGLNGVDPARHRHRGGIGPRGLNGLDGPGSLLGVGPDGAHGGVPVDHVIALHGGDRDQTAVAVHLAGGEGQGGLPAALGHDGALHLPVDEGDQVGLARGVQAVAQLLDVGGPLPGFGREEVIEEVDRVLAGEGGGRLAGGDTPVQLQALVHGQLARGVGAREVAGLIPQQGEDH